MTNMARVPIVNNTDNRQCHNNYVTVNLHALFSVLYMIFAFSLISNKDLYTLFILFYFCAPLYEFLKKKKKKVI